MFGGEEIHGFKMLEIEKIKKILPQSYPMLMLDRVLELTEEKIIALKNVSINEAFFEGHFKDKKIMPGTLIIEAMAQAWIVLYNFKFKTDPKQTRKDYYLGSVKAKFFHPVFPGDQLKIIVTPIKTMLQASLAKAEAYVGEKKIAQAELGFSVKEKNTQH